MFYFWAGWELGFLTSLYKYAYTEMKKSKVIGALALLLFSQTILFFYLAFLAFTNSVNEDLYNFVRLLIIFPTAGVALSARHFRKRSLERNTQQLKEDLKASK